MKNHIIGGNLKVVRNVNRAVILNFIREKQPISRVKIAKLTGLNKSTVSSVVTELLEEDLIFEEEAQDKNVGRNPIHLRLKLEKHFVGGINIDSTKTRVAVADVDGTITRSTLLTTEPDNPEKLIARCVEELFKLRNELDVQHFDGIGVSVAGIVDPGNSKVIFAPNLRWQNFKIGKLIEKLCPEEGRIAVDNDSRSSALAELWFGKYDIDLSNFVSLSVGPGIGTGIVVEKKLIAGNFHASGEFGHISLFEGGQFCSCGNYGCWEAYASDKATVRRYNIVKRLEPERAAKITMQGIVDSAKAEESQAIEVLAETGRFLGLGIANIVKSIDPEAIIIGGRVVQVWDIIFPEIMETIVQRSFGKIRNVQILPTSLKVRPQLLGAVSLAIRGIFDGYKITF